MPIFKYTLIKYLKAKSTWIIAAISGLLIGFLLGGLVPFSTIDPTSSNAAVKYTTTVVSTIAGVTAFLSIFASVFAGFKAASMYKDEVEDGTFLVILSKPMKRSSIIFFKWLALQTVIFGWALFTVICFVSGIAAFDKGYKIEGLKQLGVDTVTSQIPLVGGFILLILFVTGLIFSSIGLLLSTKLSVGSTIGISIALGIIIPITSLVGVFLKAEAFKPLKNSEFLQQQKKFEVMSNPTSPIAAQASEVVQKIQELENSEQVKRIYKLGVATGDTDKYSWAWVIDLQYQITQLSAFASEKVIPAAAKEYAQDMNSTSTAAPGQGSQKNTSTKVIKTQALLNEFDNSLIVKDLGETLNKYLNTDKTGGKMIETSVKGLMTAMSTNVGEEVKSVSAFDRTLLKSIVDKASAHTTQGTIPSWMSSMNDTSPITVGNIVELFGKVYTDANYNELLNYAKFEQDPKAGDAATDWDDWFKYQINKLTPNLVTELASVKFTPLGNITQANLRELVKSFGDLVVKLNNPITSFFVKDTNLKSATTNILNKEFTYTVNGQQVRETYEEAAKKFISSSAVLGKYSNQLSPKDLEAVIELVSASMSGNLSEIKSVDYVNKNGLLAAYIIIALALVPIAYWVVKKQDFR